MSDGSLASQTEDWIVTQVRAIQFGGGPAIDSEDVQPWEGSESGDTSKFEEELFKGKRNRLARVFWLRDRTEDIGGSQVRIAAVYVIMVGLKNYAPRGAARRGEVRGGTTTWGTNAMRNLLLAALEGKRPSLNDGTRHTDKAHIARTELVILRRDNCVLVTELEVHEVPMA